MTSSSFPNLTTSFLNNYLIPFPYQLVGIWKKSYFIFKLTRWNPNINSDEVHSQLNHKRPPMDGVPVMVVSPYLRRFQTFIWVWSVFVSTSVFSSCKFCQKLTSFCWKNSLFRNWSKVFSIPSQNKYFKIPKIHHKKQWKISHSGRCHFPYKHSIE
jgi:hypothetical protein